MVVLRNIKSEFYINLGFCTKVDALDFLKKHNKTGRHFKTENDLKEYLQNEQNKKITNKAIKLQQKVGDKKIKVIKTGKPVKFDIIVNEDTVRKHYNNIKKIIKDTFPKEIKLEDIKKDRNAFIIYNLSIGKHDPMINNIIDDEGIDGMAKFIQNFLKNFRKNSTIYKKNAKAFDPMLSKLYDYYLDDIEYELKM